MKRTHSLIGPAGFFLTLTLAFATTVIPPTFEELVDQAEIIFQGDVSDVKSQWVGEGAERHIVTYVSFKIEDALKGNPGEHYTIRMLGGTVDGETMGVSDAPKFKVGDRDILFVQSNGSQFVPLVGIMHGRFRIRTDPSGAETLMTNAGEPVRNLAGLGKDQAGLPNEPELNPAQFKAAIRNRLQGAR